MRIHPDVKLNFLASPPLVVAFALAGHIERDLLHEPVGYDPNGTPVYLREIWPDQKEIAEARRGILEPGLFVQTYTEVYRGDERWKSLDAPAEEDYRWDPSSNYISEAPFFKDLSVNPPIPAHIQGARALLVLGDSVTTDHISPAGKFGEDSPAGEYLLAKGVTPDRFNSYGSRRGNHEVMVRGTFANVSLQNLLVSKRGGFTLYFGAEAEPEELSVWEAARRYREKGTPLIVIAGKEYGTGSSRDWAAKGKELLGVKAVIAESFERIHRSNLIGMGILPLQFTEGQSRESLGLTGKELYTIDGIESGPEKSGRDMDLKPGGF